MDPDLAALIAEYEESAPKRGSKGCKTCDLEQREFIDLMLDRGASASGLSIFLKQKFGIEVGESSLRRHRRLHGRTEEDR